VVKIPQEEDVNELIQQMDMVNPDLVIINQDESVDYGLHPRPFAQRAPCDKIFTINFENNSMEMFSRQKEWITETSDFLTFLEAECI